jgi:alcohol dehydrogenase
MGSPEYYEFFSQAKIISGNKAMEQIAVELDGFDSGKPLVITNKKKYGSCSSKKLIKAFYNSNVIIGALYDDAPEYANMNVIKDLATLFRDRGCDSIIALGNGVVVDIAKGVNILVSERDDDIIKYKGENKISSHLKPLIVVPLGVPSALDMSNRAIIEGLEYHSDFLFPDLVCIDKRNARSSSPEVVAESGVVALTQAVEGYIAKPGNPMTDSYAYAAIQYIYENLQNGIKRPCKKKTGLALINASAMASVVYSNAPAGIVYSVSDALSKITGFSLGLCAGVILPYGLQYQTERGDGVRGELLMALAGLDIYAQTNINEKAGYGIELLEILIENTKLFPDKLEKLNIPEYVLSEAAKNAASDKYSYEECLLLLTHAWNGTDIPKSSKKKPVAKKVVKKKASAKKKAVVKKKAPAKKKAVVKKRVVKKKTSSKRSKK